MTESLPAQVHAFVLCRDAYLKSGEWSIKGVIWNFKPLEPHPIDFAAYCYLSGIRIPVELSVRVRHVEAEKTIWESKPLRLVPEFQTWWEGKIDLKAVPIPDLAPSGGTHCEASLLLNGKETAVSHQIAIH
jgi:hypothetical protein